MSSVIHLSEQYDGYYILSNKAMNNFCRYSISYRYFVLFIITSIWIIVPTKKKNNKDKLIKRKNRSKCINKPTQYLLTMQNRLCLFFYCYSMFSVVVIAPVFFFRWIMLEWCILIQLVLLQRRTMMKYSTVMSSPTYF